MSVASTMTTKWVPVLVDSDIAADEHLTYECQGCCQRNTSVLSMMGAVYKCKICDCYYHFNCQKPGDTQCQHCGASALEISFFVQNIGLSDWITVFEQVEIHQETEEQSAAEDTGIFEHDRKHNVESNRPENCSRALAASGQVSTAENPTDDSMCRNLYNKLSLAEAKEQNQKQPMQHRRGKRDRSRSIKSATLKDATGKNDYSAEGQGEPKYKAPKLEKEENGTHGEPRSLSYPYIRALKNEVDEPASPVLLAHRTNEDKQKTHLPFLTRTGFFRHNNSISEEKTEVDEQYYDCNTGGKPTIEQPHHSEGESGVEEKDGYRNQHNDEDTDSIAVGQPHCHQDEGDKEEKDGYHNQHNEDDADSSIVVYDPQDMPPTKEDNRLDLCTLNVKNPAEIVMDDIDEFNPSCPFPKAPAFDLMLSMKGETEVVLKIPGPDPKMGRIPLNRLQIQEVEDQGQLISGDVTSAYLGLLSKSPLLLDEKDPAPSDNSHRGNCRFFKFAATSDFVWTSLKRSKEEMKSWEKAWTAVDKNRGRRKPHCNLVDDIETITALQIFEGNCDAGHFACLIIDRRVLPDGIFTYFDSGKRFGYTSMAMMKECFEGSRRAANKDSIWIEAELPQQGSKTMDCGVWMCILIASFLRSLKEKNGFDVPGGLQVYKEVTVRISPPEDSSWYRVGGSISTKLLGWFGRAHIRESLFNKKIHKNPIALSMLEYEIT